MLEHDCEGLLVHHEALNSWLDCGEEVRWYGVSDEELWTKAKKVRKKTGPLPDPGHLPKGSPLFIGVMRHPFGGTAAQTTLGSTWQG